MLLSKTNLLRWQTTNPHPSPISPCVTPAPTPPPAAPVFRSSTDSPKSAATPSSPIGPTRHADAFEQCVAEGYAAAKLKIGQDPRTRGRGVQRNLADLPLRWRLDANAQGRDERPARPLDPVRTSGPLVPTHFLAQLSAGIRRNIEFLEDPTPYDSAAWSALSEREKIPLALDWEIPSTPPPWLGAQILVIKPASQDAFPLALTAAHAGMEVVVTHSMDHPLGQAVALWTAMRLRQRHGDLVRDSGLQSIGLYAPNEFSAQIRYHGPQTEPPPGTGFGFDQLLEHIPWKTIR